MLKEIQVTGNKDTRSGFGDGTNDTFGESGKPSELLTKYGLDTPNIVAAAEKVIARKNA